MLMVLNGYLNEFRGDRMRITAFVLGLIFSLMVLLGGAFFMAILGIVGSTLVFKHPKASGVLLIIAAFLGVGTPMGVFGMVIGLAAIFAFAGSKKKSTIKDLRKYHLEEDFDSIFDTEFDTAVFGKKKYGGAIAHFNMEKFWKSLSKKEREAINEAANMGLSMGIGVEEKEILDKGNFGKVFQMDDEEKESIELSAIAYFGTIVGNLVNHHPELAIKIYEYLIKNHKPHPKGLFSLYFLHMHGMKAYKKLNIEDKAIKAAEENLKLTLRLKNIINDLGVKTNPCYDYLKLKKPNHILVKKIQKGNFSFLK